MPLDNEHGTEEKKEVPAVPEGHGGKQVHETHLAIARPLAVMKPYEFKFRAVKDKDNKIVYKKDATGAILKDAAGNPIPDKRAPLNLMLPIPTVDGIHAALADVKQQEFLIQVLESVIYDAAKEQINDEDLKIEDQSGIRLDRLTIAALANMPASQRRGGGISAEMWEAFSKDFNAIMPKITGKDTTKIGNAAKFLVGRLQGAKNVKPMLIALRDYLNLWFTSTSPENQEELAPVYTFLSEKAEVFLAQDEESMLANIA